MRISDWSSDVCSSDLVDGADAGVAANEQGEVQTNEILVTANRREQNIQDIAISVSALGERDIERFNVQSGADLVRSTPGVFVSNAAAGSSQQYSIRGEIGRAHG